MDLKKKYRKIKFISFLKGKWSKSALKILEQWTDFVIIDNLEKLSKIVTDS
jgi:hypothetical protein